MTVQSIVLSFSKGVTHRFFILLNNSHRNETLLPIYRMLYYKK